MAFAKRNQFTKLILSVVEMKHILTLDLPSWLFRCCLKGTVERTDVGVQICFAFIPDSGHAAI